MDEKEKKKDEISRKLFLSRHTKAELLAFIEDKDGTIENLFDLVEKLENEKKDLENERDDLIDKIGYARNIMVFSSFDWGSASDFEALYEIIVNGKKKTSRTGMIVGTKKKVK